MFSQFYLLQSYFGNMKNLLCFILFISVFSFSQEEKRLALVIGNSEYIKGPLKNPVNDASLIAKTLEDLDFEVMLYKNLETRSSMLKAISEFGQKRPLYDVGFVYYAGHGIQVNNENFLIPTNELINNKLQVEDYAVSLQKILRYLESSEASSNVNFLVLDACRDNPYEMSWSRSSKGNGLAKVPPPAGSLIAFSTDSNQTAADGDGENSLYSLSLSKNLTKENISIEQVFKNVLTEVLDESENTQSPVYESKLTGETYALNRTFSVYNSSLNEIFKFVNIKIKNKNLVDALYTLNDAANYYKSKDEIEAEIEIRLKIIESYIFYGSKESVDDLKKSNDIHINYAFGRFVRKYNEDLFESKFDFKSYKIFISNLTYLLSNKSEEFTSKVDYNSLLSMYYFQKYQQSGLLGNNEGFGKFIMFDLSSAEEISDFINKNNINLNLSSIALFWKNKLSYFLFRVLNYNDYKIVNSFEQVDKTITEFTEAQIDLATANMFTENDITKFSDIDKKILEITKDKYPEIEFEIYRQIHDMFGYTAILNPARLENSFFISVADVSNHLKSINSIQSLTVGEDNKFSMDLNWYIRSLISYLNMAISSEDFDLSAKIYPLIIDYKNFLIFHNDLILKIKTSADKDLIDSYNHYATINNLRTSFWHNYSDFIFSDESKNDYELLSKKAEIILDINNHEISLINHVLDYYNSIINEDFTYSMENSLFSNEDNMLLQLHAYSNYVLTSDFQGKGGDMEKKMLQYERKIKTTNLIRSYFLNYFSAYEVLPPTQEGSQTINENYTLASSRLLNNLIQMSNPEEDEYLILKYFELKLIFLVVKHSTFAWDINDIIDKFNYISKIADENDDFLFKLNLDQSVKRFISNLPYKKYQSLYGNDQFSSLVDKLQLLIN